VFGLITYCMSGARLNQDVIVTLVLFGRTVRWKPSMFGPQRCDGESHDDADRDFKESVQRNGPR
jgi:hypothetical protein